MNFLKKTLLSTTPGLYYFLRDRYQWFNKHRKNEIDQILRDAENATTKEALLEFTNRHIKAHQVPYEIFSLIEAIQALQPKTFVEIGTADGGTHFLIRKLCESISDSVAIDTDIRNKFLIDRLTNTSQSHYLRGYSNSDNVLSKFKSIFPNPAMVDVLFIDGDHSYDGVKSDFHLYKNCVRSGGFIIFHDIVPDWNQRYGKATNKYTGGVPTFFSEVKDDYEHLTFVENPEQDGFGIGVLIQP